LVNQNHRIDTRFNLPDEQHFPADYLDLKIEENKPGVWNMLMALETQHA